METKTNTIRKRTFATGEGTFKYYDEIPLIIFNGKNFEQNIYGDEARELFRKIIGVDNKD